MAAWKRQDDRYLHGVELEVELGGAPFLAMVHIGLVNGRASCVGLDLHAFNERQVDDVMKIEPLPGWDGLTARRLRELRLEGLVEEARSAVAVVIDEALEYAGAYWTDPEIQEARQTQQLLEGHLREARSGRPPTVGEQHLVEVVVPVYQHHIHHGGRSPVRAVREALEGTGAIAGSGARGEVTIGQARAVVRRARKLGLLDTPEARQTEEGENG